MLTLGRDQSQRSSPAAIPLISKYVANSLFHGFSLFVSLSVVQTGVGSSSNFFFFYQIRCAVYPHGQVLNPFFFLSQHLNSLIGSQPTLPVQTFLSLLVGFSFFYFLFFKLLNKMCLLLIRFFFEVFYMFAYSINKQI